MKNPKFTARFKEIRIDYQKWEKLLAAMLIDEIHLAGIAWLNATALSVIPVWSGASKATFLKLARSIGFAISINPIVTPDGKYALGESVGFAKSEGEVDTKNVKSGIVTFKYSTTLEHLIFNEYNNANTNRKAGRVFSNLKTPGPYHFQEKGTEAFREYTKTVMGLPSPWKTLKFKAIRVG